MCLPTERVQRRLVESGAGARAHGVLRGRICRHSRHRLRDEKVSDKVVEKEEDPEDPITCSRLDPKTILSLSLLVNVIGSLGTPFTVVLLRNHLYVAAVRLVMGFGSGGLRISSLFFVI